jgi:hypothetical protein
MTEPSPAHVRIATLFSVLHDGVIARVERVGTSLTLTVHIGYLAERIVPGARDLRVTLRGVRDLRYLPWADAGEAQRPAVDADEVLSGEVDVLEGEVDVNGEVIVRILRSGPCASDVGGELRFLVGRRHDPRRARCRAHGRGARGRGARVLGGEGLYAGVTIPP